MKYLSGFVTGFLCGGGAVCAALLYLHCTGDINLYMLDPRYVRELYQPKARWIRNHTDYSYHGRHYNPFDDHTAAAPKPAWQINPDCSGCVYEGMCADFDPCKSCKRAFDGCQDDNYEAREKEAETEESHEGQCYRCKHFEDETLESPCNDCKWAFPYGDTTHEDHFEADEED